MRLPDDVDPDEDARLRRRRERGTLCVAILGVVVALISLIATVMPTIKENSCDAYLTSLSDNMMLPYHYELPQPYVNCTGLSTELAKLVEHSQAPRSQVRLNSGARPAPSGEDERGLGALQQGEEHVLP